MNRRLFIVSVLAAGLVLALPGAAFAKKPPKSGGGTSSTGYDVSYPQCGRTLPAAPAFAIVGVNNGIVYSTNPCLGSEYAWGTTATSTTVPKVSLYVNTANPGPSSTHWPTGQSAPRPCPAAALTADCSYDYGWNAAADSYARAVATIGPAAASAAPWWLDVESVNSWTTDTSANAADIQGALDYFTTSPAAGGAGLSGPVGIYTDASSWQAITSSTSAFASYPSWVPGASSLSGAQLNCSRTITGGRVQYTQYPGGSIDGDYACR